MQILAENRCVRPPEHTHSTQTEGDSTGSYPVESRLSTKNQLASLRFCSLTPDSVGGPRQSGAVLAVYRALERIGWRGLAAPAAAIAEQVSRFAGPISISTLGRVNRRLEQLGYIRRSQARFRCHAHESVILFLPKMCGKKCETHLHRSKKPTFRIDNNIQHIESTYQDLKQADLVVKQPNARARVADFDKWSHSIIYTLRQVVTGPKRNQVLKRARLELENPARRVSGVNWPRWDPDGSGREWRRLSIGMREHIARTQIAPYLERDPICDEPTPEKVSALVRSLCGAGTGEQAASLTTSNRNCLTPGPKPNHNLLDAAELAQLEAARKRAQAHGF